ncbi:MAG: putative outer membrane repeat protein [Paraglaciecola sp.]|jgi:predicted outer membrane repeat protein
MKVSIILIIVLAISIQLSAGNITFVKEGATGNGSSWENASGDLQSALQAAMKGTQIWVAEGIYFPADCNKCNDRARGIMFTVNDGVALYGGFAGTEDRLIQRKWKQHPTTLSGNIGRADNLDNSFSVIYTRNVSKSTLVDGFLIADGNADGIAVERDFTRAGAGWYNDGENGVSNPTIRNCIFMYNQASEGGAIFNNGYEGVAMPNIKNCTFIGNLAATSGGAIFNYTKNRKRVVVFTNCKFVSNEAKIGGGVFSMGRADLVNNQLEFCTFLNNKAQAGQDWHVDNGGAPSTELRKQVEVGAGTNM